MMRRPSGATRCNRVHSGAITSGVAVADVHEDGEHARSPSGGARRVLVVVHLNGARGHPKRPEAIRKTSEATRSNQKDIRSDQKDPKGIRRDQKGSEATRSHPKPLEAIRSH